MRTAGDRRGRTLGRRFIRFLAEIPHSRGLVLGLIVINFLGSLYGFYWYWPQLREFPVKVWPVIFDSPLATLFFSLFLLAIYFGRRIPLLEAMAFISMVKYGLWTSLVLGHYMVLTRSVPFDAAHLTLSHFSMALESFIFMRYYRPAAVWGLAATIWFVFNDYMDYYVGTVPTLPLPEYVGLVKIIGFSLTVFAVGIFLLTKPKLPAHRTLWDRGPQS